MPRAALALELCGEKAGAQMTELTRRYPSNTGLISIWLPILRAALEMNRGNAALAIDILRPKTSYEAAAEFWPQYLRGQAYLRLRRGSESSTEFRKILEHRDRQSTQSCIPWRTWGWRALRCSSEIQPKPANPIKHF